MTPQKRGSRRRALVLAFTAVCLIFLLGFASLAVDIGHAYAIKAKLQNTADAAALAGAGALFSDELILKIYDPRPEIITDVKEYTLKNAQAYKLANQKTGELLDVCGDDIVIGHLTDPMDTDEAIDTAHAVVNAVEVTLRRDKYCNGPVNTFFAGLLGLSEMNISALATAYYDDRFAGFFPPPIIPGPLTPFSISRTYYEEQLANPKDDLSWNPTTQTIQKSSDGIGEVWIYPEKQKGSSKNDDEDTGIDDLPDDGAGNYGTLNIGIDNEGTSDLGDQVQNGVTQQQMIDAIGTSDMRFIDSDGGSLSYTLPGNPGISAGLSSYVEERIGDVIAFFIHDSVAGGGSNAQFNIVGIAFGRLVEVEMHGSPSKKRIVIQPAVYGGPGIITDPNAPSSNGLVAVLKLIR